MNDEAALPGRPATTLNAAVRDVTSGSGEGLLTARQLSEFLGFAPATVVDWAEGSKIPHFKIGGRLRFRMSEVETWLEAQRRGGVA